MIANKSFEIFNISTSVTFISETDQIIGRMITAGSEPILKYKKGINRWITKLVADADLPLIKSMYVFEARTEIESLLNWISGEYNGSKVGSPIFSPGLGWKSEATGYINSNFSASNTNHENNLTFHYSAGTTVDPSSSGAYYGAIDSGGVSHYLIPNHTNANPNFSVQNFKTSGSLSNNGPLYPGLSTIERDAASIEVYIDGVEEVIIGSSNPVAITENIPYFLLARNNDGTPENFLLDDLVGLIGFGSFDIDRDNIKDGHDQYLIDIA